MNSTFAELVWKIDVVLLIALISLALFIVAFSAWRGHLASRKRRKLLKLKERIDVMFHAPKGTCPIEISRLGPEEFLDIVKNRNIWAAFFNQEEQEFFKGCFVSQSVIQALEGIAGKNHNKWKRIEAMLALGYANASSALGIFEKGLFDKDADLSYFSMIALGQIKTDLSARILLEFLRKHEFSGQRIASILETFPASIVGDAMRLTEDRNPAIRFWALKIASRLTPLEHIAEILRLLTDGSEHVRSAACECLGAIKGKKAEAALLRASKDASWMVRTSAVIALAKIGGEEAVKCITKMLSDNSLTVINAVKEVIIPDIDSYGPYLEAVMNGDDELAKKSAREVISKSNHPDLMIKIRSKEHRETA